MVVKARNTWGYGQVVLMQVKFIAKAVIRLKVWRDEMSDGMPLKIKIVSGAVSMVSAIALLAVPAMSNAAGFTFDGIKDGDPYTKAFEVNWFNGHDQDNYPSGGPQAKTTVHYGEGQEGMSGDTFSWLFLEVPLYAKNMVWGDAFDPAKNPDGAAAAQALLDGYGKALSFSDATGSEKVLFGDTSLGDGKSAGAGHTLLDLFKGDITDNTTSWNVVGFKDSTDYLLGTPAGIAECGFSDPEVNCNASGRTMSFEVKLTALNDGGAALEKSLTDFGVSFHLSPDATLTPPDMSEVPVPAAFWLFGSALIGFIGFSRRTNLG
ncbi:hypothetical protein N8198_05635 [Gammaproteobacteria bacterium]|nr:hypothetical protein [Gammaproteobacteria bacterium]